MVMVWITRSPNHPNYPGGVWRFWADDENCPWWEIISKEEEAVRLLLVGVSK